MTDPSAKCLDGSQGAYYISRDGDPDKFLLWFEGGGWCGDKDEDSTLRGCYYRTKTPVGSSNEYRQKEILSEGFSSRSE